MHTQHLELGASSVPAFLSKLWMLVEDPTTNDFICWDTSGKSFHVLDQTRFAKEMLPLYFKHNNIASFIRQLNMYGFRKVITVEAANIKMERDYLEFAHPCFLQGQENLLEFIKRKTSGAKAAGDGGGGIGRCHEDFSKICADVSALNGRQDSMTTKLEHLKMENEMVWKELVVLRQRHIKQEQIVNKLIQFLVTLVGDRTIGGMKRKLPLMLQDTSANDSPPPAKIACNSHNECSSEISATKKSSSNNNTKSLAILKKYGEAPTLELTDLLENVEEYPTKELFPLGDLVVTEAEDNLATGEVITFPAVSMDAHLPMVEPEDDTEISSLVNSSTNLSAPITTVAKADTSLYSSFFDKIGMMSHLDSQQNNICTFDLFPSGQSNFDSELSGADTSFTSLPFDMLFSTDNDYLSTPNLMLEDDD